MKILTTNEVAQRWNINPQTLRKWRMLGAGPRYFKIGDGVKAHVRYRLLDIENYEQCVRGAAIDNERPSLPTRELLVNS